MKHEISSTELLQQIKAEHPGLFHTQDGEMTMVQVRYYVKERTGIMQAQPNMFNMLKAAGIEAVRKSPGLPSFFRLADIENFCDGLLEVTK